MFVCDNLVYLPYNVYCCSFSRKGHIECIVVQKAYKSLQTYLFERRILQKISIKRNFAVFNNVMS